MSRHAAASALMSDSVHRAQFRGSSSLNLEIFARSFTYVFYVAVGMDDPASEFQTRKAIRRASG